MEFIRPNINIPFDKLFKPMLIFSAALTTLAIVLIFSKMFVTKTFNWGPDFAGGTEVQLRFVHDPDLAKIRDVVTKAGFQDPAVSSFGGAETREVLVRVAQTSTKEVSISNKMMGALQAGIGNDEVTLLRIDEVGPKVGFDLKINAVISLVIANFLIFIYVWHRFTPAFAPGGILALVHDVFIAWGAYTFLNLPFDLTTVAALLTIVGYSNNDTIIIYDRIRDHMKRARRADFIPVVVKSLNETLSRTILTSTLTFVVVLAQFIFSKGGIRDFAFIMLVGIFVGTYSSIFVATPVLIWLEKRRA